MLSVTISRTGVCFPEKPGGILEFRLRHANFSPSGSTAVSVRVICGRSSRSLLEWLPRRSAVIRAPGLPNASGGYDESPEEFAAILGELAGRAWSISSVDVAARHRPISARIADAVRKFRMLQSIAYEGRASRICRTKGTREFLHHHGIVAGQLGAQRIAMALSVWDGLLRHRIHGDGVRRTTTLRGSDPKSFDSLPNSPTS